MKDRQSTAIKLSTNTQGYTIIRAEALRASLIQAFLLDLSTKAERPFACINQAKDFLTIIGHASFQEKRKRILAKDFLPEVVRQVLSLGLINDKKGDFITDEENISYPNIYWRIVRPNSPSDVGSTHADSWFWELGHGQIPSTHKRVKAWLPIIQDDESPSLAIIPGSHLRTFIYDSITGSDGKSRPHFKDLKVISELIPAPVKMGEAIIFNDNLLHTGRTTNSTRISFEWTMACYV